MITILTDSQSPRLKYVADTIFKKWFKLEYVFASSPDEVDAGSCCIAYGKYFLPRSINVFNEGLLSESFIRQKAPLLTFDEKLPVIFEAEGSTEFDLPFDVFSAVFFCLSRYEEYINTKRDEHGRFQAADSIFFGYNRTPYLDRWILRLESLIKKQLPEWKNPRSISWLSTMDMDIAFAYKGRSNFRMIGASVKDILNGRLDRMKERVSVLSGKSTDPFDTYQIFLDEEESDSKMVFVPTGDRGHLDNNLDSANQLMKQHIASLGEKVRLGLHPSYHSLGKRKQIANEKLKLEGVIKSAITASRQHFLRLELPETMNALQSLGIEKEFSLGFHDEVGFRSGTAFGHNFYDLKNEQELPLEIIPLVAMDSAMNKYMKLSAEEAVTTIKNVLQGMHESGGIFTTVWHNHSLSETDDWKGWRSVFQSIPDMVRSHR